MLTTQMVRTNGVAASLSGGSGVREFAAREFPREDRHWVAVQASRSKAPQGVRPSVWARIRGWLGAPGKAETEPEANLEPTVG